VAQERGALLSLLTIRQGGKTKMGPLVCEGGEAHVAIMFLLVERKKAGEEELHWPFVTVKKDRLANPEKEMKSGKLFGAGSDPSPSSEGGYIGNRREQQQGRGKGV